MCTSAPGEPDAEDDFLCLATLLIHDTLAFYPNERELHGMVARGEIDAVGEFVSLDAMSQPDFGIQDVLDAADRRNGLLELARDADYADRLIRLAEGWEALLLVSQVLPSLSWPVVKVDKSMLPQQFKKSKKRKKK